MKVRSKAWLNVLARCESSRRVAAFANIGACDERLYGGLNYLWPRHHQLTRCARHHAPVTALQILTQTRWAFEHAVAEILVHPLPPKVSY